MMFRAGFNSPKIRINSNRKKWGKKLKMQSHSRLNFFAVMLNLSIMV